MPVVEHPIGDTSGVGGFRRRPHANAASCNDHAVISYTLLDVRSSNSRHTSPLIGTIVGTNIGHTPHQEEDLERIQWTTPAGPATGKTAGRKHKTPCSRAVPESPGRSLL